MVRAFQPVWFALGFLGTSAVTGTWGRGDWAVLAALAFWGALRVQRERLDL